MNHTPHPNRSVELQCESGTFDCVLSTNGPVAGGELEVQDANGEMWLKVCVPATGLPIVKTSADVPADVVAAAVKLAFDRVGRGQSAQPCAARTI